MHSFTTFTAIVALAARLVAAQDKNFDSVTTPAQDTKVAAGKPFTVTWTLITPDTPTGPTTITLVGGTGTLDLHPIAVIGHVNNNDLKFEWAVDPSLGAATVYGLNFTLDADNSHFQYSQPFQIVGGAAVSSSASGGGGPATTSSAGSGAASSGPTTTGAASTSSASSSSSEVAAGTTTTGPASAPTTTGKPQHPGNSTATNSTTASNKTSTTAKPTPTSGAAVLNAAIGALAVALVASAAMHWGL